MVWFKGLNAHAAGMADALVLRNALFQLAANVLPFPDGFGDGRRFFNGCRRSHGFGWFDRFRVLNRLGLPDFLPDGFCFRNSFFRLGTKPFLHPAAHIFDNGGQALRRRQPGGPARTQIQRPHGPNVFGFGRCCIFRHRFTTASETELGQIIAQPLQFNGRLALVRIRHSLAQQFSVISKDANPLAAPRNGDVKLTAASEREEATSKTSSTVLLWELCDVTA